MNRPLSRRGFTLIELLVVIAIIAVLIALLLPAVQMAREAARRTQCRNHLLQLALATHNYEHAHEVLPPGVVDSAGPIAHQPQGYHFGWIVQLLPFIEQQNVHKHFDFSVSLYDPRNTTARSVVIAVLVCPSESLGQKVNGLGPSNYAGCHHHAESPIDADNSGMFFLNSSVRTESIPDGSSNTISLGEKLVEVGHLGWASGTASTLRNMGSMINADIARPPITTGLTSTAKPLEVGGFSSMHHGGALFAFGDGSVRLLSNNTDKTILERLANRSDGSFVGADEF